MNNNYQEFNKYYETEKNHNLESINQYKEI